MTQQAVKDLITTRAQELGTTLKALSLAIGRNQAYLQQFIKLGKPKKLDEVDRAKLATLLEVSQDALRGDTIIETEGGQTDDSHVPAPNARIASLEPIAQVDRSLPFIEVHGTSQGGPDGRFELNGGDPIDYIPRPVAVAHAKNVYALYVEGESMSPVFEPGDPAVINPDRAPKIGDYVCIFLKNGEGNHQARSYIKRLKRRTAEKIIVEQLNPLKEMSFSIEDVHKIHRVYRPAELIKV